MFEDLKDPNLSISYDPKNNGQYKKLIWVAFGLAVIVIIIVLIFVIKNKLSRQDQPENKIFADETSTTTGSSTLPINDKNSFEDEGLSDDEFNKVKAEDFTFANFYVKPDEKFSATAKGYKLPIFIKTDVSNYYELSRKIDLSDDQLNEINKNGFSIIPNVIAKDNNNFYGTYDKLIEGNIPVLVTEDFLIYYYQNRMKEVYDDIKSNIFYRDLWKINKQLFEIASNRYKKNKARMGEVNDPVLEGQRLEAAYFATALELLKPEIADAGKQLSDDESKFSQTEISEYDFDLPEFLAEDVRKELALIRKADSFEKSPVFRYDRDYYAFKIPKEYLRSSKLSKYYLAGKWVNSIFPLYFKDETCKNCLLDKYDWLNNFIANSYIAKDFNDNQDIKNRWARVYKVMSYFGGLRKELTYLDYQKAFSGIYGKEYNIENIFSVAQGLDKSISEAVKIRKEIEKNSNFPQIAGGLSRADAGNKPYIGMRLLQETYWPDDYILKQLVAPKVSAYTKAFDNKNKSNITICQSPNKAVFLRCGAIGLDIMNLLEPVVSNSYFNENTSYINYTNQSKILKKELDAFSLSDWHSSNYWTMLDISRKSVISQPGLKGPIYTETQNWKNKNLNTALGAWVNLRLPADKLAVNWQENGLNAGQDLKIFVEPNLPLLNEFSANAKMLSQMLSSLRIIKDVDLTAKKINEFIDDVNLVKTVTIKELSDEDLDKTDQSGLSTLIKKYYVGQEGNKSSAIDLGKKKLSESVEGVNLILAVYQTRDRKILTIGPIFNQKEH